MPSALAIGSMVPDAWYFIPFVDRGHSHEALGVLWFCLPAGLFAYAAFHLIFKQPLLVLLPRSLSGRLCAWTTPALPPAPWVWVLASLVAGIATHLAWDSLTHPGHFRFLEMPVAGDLRLHRLLQHASTLLGAAFLACWLWQKLRATRPRHVNGELQPQLRMAVVTAMIAAPAIAFVCVLHALDGEAMRMAMRVGGVSAVWAFGLVALPFCLAWRFRFSRGGR